MSYEDKELFQNEEAALAASEVAEEVEDEESLVIKIKKPYKFEGIEYNEIDLTGLETLSAEDMIAVNRIMDRSGAGLQVMPEVTMEYACILAARAAGKPIEFFKQLPAKYAVRVKNRVMGFLYGAD